MDLRFGVSFEVEHPTTTPAFINERSFYTADLCMITDVIGQTNTHTRTHISMHINKYKHYIQMHTSVNIQNHILGIRSERQTCLFVVSSYNL